MKTYPQWKREQRMRQAGMLAACVLALLLGWVGVMVMVGQ